MPVKTGLKVVTHFKKPWDVEKAIQAYEQEPLEKGQIVFYGPSNFTRWSTKWGMQPLREVLLGKSGAPCAVNRGFGTSNAELQLYYYPRMVRPLEPKVLVYFGFGNQHTYTDEETWELMQRVVAYALADFPGIHVYLLGRGYNPKMTEEGMEKRQKANGWLKEFAENTPGCYYLDTFSYKPLWNPDLFVEDGVHMNQEGYRVYEAFFKEALAEELAQF